MDSSHSALPRRHAYAALAGSILCFSSVLLFIKHFTSYLDVWVVNGMRYSIAALIWLPVVAHILKRQPRLHSVWKAAIVPAIINFCGQVGWGITPYYSDASIVAFGIESTFLFTVLFGLTFLPCERRIARLPLFWLGALACVAGVVVIGLASLKVGAKTSPLGLAFILGTALFWGLYPVSVRHFMGRYPARLSFGVISSYTAAGLIILMDLRGDFGRLLNLGTTNWVLLVLSAIIGIAISHVLLYKSISSLGAVVTSGAGLVQPFITWLGAVLLFGETMTPVQIAGGLVIVTGAFLLILAEYRVVKPPPSTTPA